MLHRVFFGFLMSVWLGFAAVTPANAEQPALRVFVLLESAGFVHDIVKTTAHGGPSVVEQVLTGLADAHGWELTFSRDATQLDAGTLKQTDLVVLYTTGPIPLDVQALDHWVRGGGWLLGTHCATDTLKDNAAMTGLLGAVFRDHPWNAGDTVTVRVNVDDHPACKPYAPESTFKEEIYRFQEPLSRGERVLMSLDAEATEKKVEDADKHGFPIAWSRAHGAGRVFYTSLGHREDVWRSDAFQKHLLGAVRWLCDGRPREPWVFRSVLDGRARTVTVALHDHLWLAYDAASGAWVKAWRGHVEFVGSVWDGRHGPQPVSRAEHTYFTDDHGTGWWAVRDGEPIDAQSGFVGYTYENGGVALRTRVTATGVGEATVTERPEADVDPGGSVTWVRQLTVEGLPAGVSLRALVPGSPVALHGDADQFTLTSTTAAHLLTVTGDGTATLHLTLEP